MGNLGRALHSQPTFNISCDLQSRPDVFKIENCWLTLESDIHIGAVCCFSIRSVTLLYQLSACRGKVEVSTWPHNFSIFWHCSNNFLLLRCAFLGTIICSQGGEGEEPCKQSAKRGKTELRELMVEKCRSLCQGKKLFSHPEPAGTKQSA